MSRIWSRPAPFVALVLNMAAILTVAALPLVAYGQLAYCPNYFGYTANPDMDHPGDDLTAYIKDPAVECNKRIDCKGFNLGVLADNDRSMGYVKKAADPLKPVSGACFYVKGTTQCPQIQGYQATADVDHPPDDLSGYKSNPWEGCNSLVDCAGFNLGADGKGDYTKGVYKANVDTPYTYAFGCCLYRKV